MTLEGGLVEAHNSGSDGWDQVDPFQLVSHVHVLTYTFIRHCRRVPFARPPACACQSALRCICIGVPGTGSTRRHGTHARARMCQPVACVELKRSSLAKPSGPRAAAGLSGCPRASASAWPCPMSDPRVRPCLVGKILGFWLL